MAPDSAKKKDYLSFYIVLRKPCLGSIVTWVYIGLLHDKMYTIQVFALGIVLQRSGRTDRLLKLVPGEYQVTMRGRCRLQHLPLLRRGRLL